MLSPTGIQIKIGQVWKEVDPRFERFITVTGLDPINAKIQLNGKTWASLVRFSEKRGGYKFVQ